MTKEGITGRAERSETETPANFFRELQIQFLIHELKDPLAVIEVGLRLLLEKRDKYGQLSARQEKTLRRLLRGALKARGMLNDLLEIGRGEAGRFVQARFKPGRSTCAVVLDALEAIKGQTPESPSRFEDDREIMAFLAEQGVQVRISQELEDLEITQDESMFRTIVGNLVKNGLHYRRQRLEIRLERAGEALCLEVGDDGPGVKPEHRDLIFQLYARPEAGAWSARQGHGLGLAGAQIMARRLGGDITVECGTGSGATFRLLLPLGLSDHGAGPGPDYSI